MGTLLPSPRYNGSYTNYYTAVIHDKLIDRSKARYIAAEYANPTFQSNEGSNSKNIAAMSLRYKLGFKSLAQCIKINIMTPKLSVYNILTGTSSVIEFVSGEISNVSSDGYYDIVIGSDKTVTLEYTDSNGVIVAASASIKTIDMQVFEGAYYLIIDQEIDKPFPRNISAFNSSGIEDSALFVDNIMYKNPIAPNWNKAVAISPMTYNNIRTGNIEFAGLAGSGGTLIDRADLYENWRDPMAGCMYDYQDKAVKITTDNHATQAFELDSVTYDLNTSKASLLFYRRNSDNSDYSYYYTPYPYSKSKIAKTVVKDISLMYENASLNDAYGNARTYVQYVTGLPSTVNGGGALKSVIRFSTLYRNRMAVRDVFNSFITEYELSDQVETVEYSFRVRDDFSIESVYPAISVTSQNTYAGGVTDTTYSTASVATVEKLARIRATVFGNSIDAVIPANGSVYKIIATPTSIKINQGTTTVVENTFDVHEELESNRRIIINHLPEVAADEVTFYVTCKLRTVRVNEPTYYQMNIQTYNTEGIVNTANGLTSAKLFANGLGIDDVDKNPNFFVSTSQSVPRYLNPHAGDPHIASIQRGGDIFGMIDRYTPYGACSSSFRYEASTKLAVRTKTFGAGAINTETQITFSIRAFSSLTNKDDFTSLQLIGNECFPRLGSRPFMYNAMDVIVPVNFRYYVGDNTVYGTFYIPADELYRKVTITILPNGTASVNVGGFTGTLNCSKTLYSDRFLIKMDLSPSGFNLRKVFIKDIDVTYITEGGSESVIDSVNPKYILDESKYIVADATLCATDTTELYEDTPYGKVAKTRVTTTDGTTIDDSIPLLNIYSYTGKSRFFEHSSLTKQIYDKTYEQNPWFAFKHVNVVDKFISPNSIRNKVVDNSAVTNISTLDLTEYASTVKYVSSQTGFVEDIDYCEGDYFSLYLSPKEMVSRSVGFTWLTGDQRLRLHYTARYEGSDQNIIAKLYIGKNVLTLSEGIGSYEILADRYDGTVKIKNIVTNSIDILNTPHLLAENIDVTLVTEFINNSLAAKEMHLSNIQIYGDITAFKYMDKTSENYVKTALTPEEVGYGKVFLRYANPNIRHYQSTSVGDVLTNGSNYTDVIFDENKHKVITGTSNAASVRYTMLNCKLWETYDDDMSADMKTKTPYRITDAYSTAYRFVIDATAESSYEISGDYKNIDISIGKFKLKCRPGKHSYEFQFYAAVDDKSISNKPTFGTLYIRYRIDEEEWVEEVFARDNELNSSYGLYYPMIGEPKFPNITDLWCDININISNDISGHHSYVVIEEAKSLPPQVVKKWNSWISNLDPSIALIDITQKKMQLYMLLETNTLYFKQIFLSIFRDGRYLFEQAERYNIDLTLYVYSVNTQGFSSINRAGGYELTGAPIAIKSYKELMEMLFAVTTVANTAPTIDEVRLFDALDRMATIINTNKKIDNYQLMYVYTGSDITDIPVTTIEATNGNTYTTVDVSVLDTIAAKYAGIHVNIAHNEFKESGHLMYSALFRLIQKADSAYCYSDKMTKSTNKILDVTPSTIVSAFTNSYGEKALVKYVITDRKTPFNLISNIGDDKFFTSSVLNNKGVMAASNTFKYAMLTTYTGTGNDKTFDVYVNTSGSAKGAYMYGTGTNKNTSSHIYQEYMVDPYYVAIHGEARPKLEDIKTQLALDINTPIHDYGMFSLIRERNNFSVFRRNTIKDPETARDYYNILIASSGPSAHLFGEREKEMMLQILNSCRIGDIISVSFPPQSTAIGGDYPERVVINSEVVSSEFKRIAIAKIIEGLTLTTPSDTVEQQIFGFYRLIDNIRKTGEQGSIYDVIKKNQDDININICNIIFAPYDTTLNSVGVSSVVKDGLSKFVGGVMTNTIINYSDNLGASSSTPLAYELFANTIKSKSPNYVNDLNDVIKEFQDYAIYTTNMAIELMTDSNTKMSEVVIYKNTVDVTKMHGAYIWFVAYRKSPANDSQPYDVAVQVFGKLIGIKILSEEPTEYHLWVRNTETGYAFSVDEIQGPPDLDIEAFCCKENSFEPYDLKPLPLMIVDHFVDYAVGECPINIYAYSVNQDIVLDRIHAPKGKRARKYYRSPVKFPQPINKDYIVIPGGYVDDAHTGIPETYPWVSPYGPGATLPSWSLPPGDGSGTPTIGEGVINDGSGYSPDPLNPTVTPGWGDDSSGGGGRPVAPSYIGGDGLVPPAPPKRPMEDVCADVWLKDIILENAIKTFTAEMWDEVISQNGSVQNWLDVVSDPTQWIFRDDVGNIIDTSYDPNKACLVIPKEDLPDPRYIKVPFTKESQIFEYLLLKPVGSIQCHEDTVEQIMLPVLKAEPELAYSISNMPEGYQYKVTEITTYNDYPFVQMENPYDESIVRTLSTTMGDIETEATSYKGYVFMKGGYDGQVFKSEATVEQYLRYLDEEVVVASTTDVPLTYINKYNIERIYDAATMVADYKTTLVEKDDPVSVVITNGDNEDTNDVTSLAFASCSNDVKKSKAQTFRFNDSFFTSSVVISEFIQDITEGAHTLKVKINDITDNVSINGEYPEEGSTMTISVASIDSQFNIECHPKSILVPYGKEFDNDGALYVGSVNGLEPYRKAYDGKKDLSVPMSTLDVPLDIVEAEYEVVIDSDVPGANVKVDYDYHEVFNGHAIGDTLTFHSDYTTPMPFERQFKTVDVVSDLLSTDSLLPATVSHKIHNPNLENLSNGRIKSLNLIIRADNPNIKIIDFEQPVFEDNEQEKNVDVTLRPINETSSNWHPKIHNGYYYFNNDEHFLYAKETPIGEYKYEEVYKDIEVIYNITGFVKLEDAITNKVMEFGGYNIYRQGIRDNTDYRKGDVFCSLMIDTMYYKKYNVGIYESPELIAEMMPSSYGVFKWDSISENGTEIVVSFKVYDDSLGAWTEWVPVQNNTVPDLPLSNKFKYRVDLYPAIETSVQPVEEVDSTESDFIVDKNVVIDNVIVNNNKIELIDTTLSGYYISDIFDYGTSVSNFGISSMGIGEYTIQVASSNIKSDLDNPAWQDVPSNGHRYYRYKVSLSPGSEIYEVVRDVTCTVSQSYTPVFKKVYFELKFDETITGYPISKTMTGKIIANEEWQYLNNNDLKVILYNEITNKGYSMDNVSMLNITSDQDVEFQYDILGNSKISARTLYTSKSFEKSKYFNFVNNRCTVSPIPQQFAPVIVYDENIGYLNRVNFVDENGNLTLTYATTINGQGRKAIALPHRNIDISTIQIKVSGVAVEFADCKLYNNILEFPDIVEEGIEISISYSILNSFYVDYNYNISEDKALICAHTSSPLSRATVYYECNKNYSDKVVESINFNTIYSPDSQGFVYITDETNESSKIEVHANPRILNANAKDFTNVYIRVLDELGNGVSGDPIIAECEYGRLMVTNNITDESGVVVFKYLAPAEPCNDTVTIKNVTGTLIESINFSIK